MRIAIDMQGAQTDSRYRGIGRYTLSLAQAMARNRGAHDIVLVLNGLFTETIAPLRAAFEGILPPSSIHIWYAPGAVRMTDPANAWRHTATQRIREAFIASLQPDAIHITSLFEGYGDDAVTSVDSSAAAAPTVVTLYDLIPLLNAEQYLRPNPRYEQYYRGKMEHMQQAHRWLAISESSANEGRQQLQLPAGAVVNISAACDAVFRPMAIDASQQQDLLGRLGIDRAFVLYSGGADARKNLPRLIRAYASLPLALREKHQLVLVGKIPAGQVADLLHMAGQAGLAETEMLLPGYVCDDDLAQLYNLCTVFVLPSLHEGFGLPALEAMSCGAATIGANCTSVPEVIGRADAMFDPYDEAAISRLLARVLSEEAFRAALVAHGLHQATLFSWDQTARRALAAFESLPLRSAPEKAAAAALPLVDALVERVAALLPAKASERELLALAHAISLVRPLPATGSGRPAAKRIWMDCTATLDSTIHSGIERVVRNLAAHAQAVGQAAGVDCQLVRLTPAGYVPTTLAAFTAPPRRLQRLRASLTQGFLVGTRALARLAPRALRKYLLGTRHEPSVARLLYRLLGTAGRSGAWLSHRADRHSATSVVTFQPGDILLLADSVWNYTPWPAVQAARSAGAWVAAVVYDIIPVTHPQFFAPVSRDKFAAALELLLEHVDAFLSISAFTEMQLRQHVSARALALPAPSMRPQPGYAHFALGAELDRLDAGGSRRAKVDALFAHHGPVYLAVGTLEPRKNHSYLLQTFQKLWDAQVEVSLLIVGRIGWMSEALLSRIRNHPLLGQRLFLWDDASDTELDYCYSQARAVLLASVVEGFGLPLVEALHKGRPVFASDIPVFREVGGPYPAYFDIAQADALFLQLQAYEAHASYAGRAADGFYWLNWSQSCSSLLTQLLALHAQRAQA